MNCVSELKEISNHPRFVDDEEGIKGMSGCGIWKVSYGRNGLMTTSASLVGIFKRQSFGGGYFVGTNLQPFIELLSSEYPELTSELSGVSKLRS